MHSSVSPAHANLTLQAAWVPSLLPPKGVQQHRVRHHNKIFHDFFLCCINPSFLTHVWWQGREGGDVKAWCSCATDGQRRTLHTGSAAQAHCCAVRSKSCLTGPPWAGPFTLVLHAGWDAMCVCAVWQGHCGGENSEKSR